MIKLESVSLTHDKTPVFQELNMVFSQNQAYLIQGKSGTGKTSLFKILLGFQTIDSGKILFNNNRLSPATIKTVRKQIFYLSQDIDLKHGILFDLINEIFEYHPQNQLDENKLFSLIDFFELDKKILTQETVRLSGGERQRAGLLIGFLLDRPIWLLDEPTSALDKQLKQKVAARILDQNKTLLIISHDTVFNDPKVNLLRWG